ncbi:putative divalent cation/proton antiporter TMEM165 isoform X1 [Planococcus citri]|uniref:putative divalent cation/proton antiporter TMEM165 isoform X1 n=1 Tax=Planococcus citri TaxID=170843 RepID=UPI0031F975F3
MKLSLITSFCLIFTICVVPNCDGTVEGQGNEPINVASPASNPAASSTESTKPEEHLGFVQAFLGAFSVIVVSELGDKTFFIAAIMAMRHPRVMVFLGAILALAFMTVLSVAFGWAVTFFPKKYTYYASTILFLIFGVKMIRDGIKMSPTDAQEEYEEVQADLRKKEEEHAKKLKSKKPKKEAVSPTIEPSDGAILVLPVTVDNIESTKNGKSEEADKSKTIPQFEKETLTKDVESGYINRNSKVKILKVLSHIIVQAFTLTFLAEWGDRSQFTTIILAARDNVYGVALGGIVGHGICTGLAVIGGRFIAQKISVKTVTIVGGFVFIIFAVITVFLES